MLEAPTMFLDDCLSWEEVFDHPTPIPLWVQQSWKVGKEFYPLWATIATHTTTLDEGDQKKNGWLKLLLVLPHMIFFDTPIRPSKGSIIKILDRIQNFKLNDIDFWRRLIAQWQSMPLPDHDTDDDAMAGSKLEALHHKVIRLAGAGELSKAARTLKAEGKIQPVNDERVKIIRDLFPKAQNFTDANDDTIAANDNQDQAQAHYHDDDEADEEGDESILKVFTNDEVANVVKKLRKGRAAGPDGLRAEFFHNLAKKNYGMIAIGALINWGLAGGVPKEAMGYLAGGTILPFAKPAKIPGGTEGTRPIVLQSIIYKLLSTALVNRLRETAQIECGSIQRGLSVGGAETITHHANMALEGGEYSQDHIGLLATDVTNAYGCLHREAIITTLKKHKTLRQVAPFVSQVYGPSQKLNLCLPVTVGKNSGKVQWVQMERGIIQGDPMAPMLYSLTTVNALVRARSVGEDAIKTYWGEKSMNNHRKKAPILFGGYLDDNTIVGPMPYLEAVYNQLKIDLGSLGLKINSSKTMLYPKPKANGETPTWAAEAAKSLGVSLAKTGVRVLGSFIGNEHFVQENLESKLTECKNLCEKLENLHHAQTATLLLRQCVVTQVNYTTRVQPPSEQLATMVQKFDALVEDTFNHILFDSAKLKLSKQGIMQAILPLREGGLGLTKVETTMNAAWLAACTQAIKACQDADELDLLKDRWKSNKYQYSKLMDKSLETLKAQALEGSLPFHTKEELIVRNDKKLQKFLMEQVILNQKKELGKNLSNNQARARNWNSAANSFATAGFTALPSEELRVDDVPFRISCLIRLGEMDKFPTNEAAMSKCTACEQKNPKLDHIITCPRTGQLAQRHSELRDFFADLLRKCHKAVEIEPHTSQVAGGKEGQRGDIATYNAYSNSGLMEIWDITIASTHTKHLKGITAGVAAEQARNRKLTTYAEIIQQKGAEIVPVAFDTAGCPGGKEVESILNRLSVTYPEPMGGLTLWSTPTKQVYVQQLASVALHRSVANAAIRMRTKNILEGAHPRSGLMVPRSSSLAKASYKAQNYSTGYQAWRGNGGGRGNGGNGGGRGGGRGRGRGRGATQGSANTAAIITTV